MKRLLAVLILTVLLSCSASRKIVDKPIVFNKERMELTLQYLDKHYGLKQETPYITPKIIVLHWTAIPSFEGSFDAFYNEKIPSWREVVSMASGLNVSSHFLVDQDGTIYSLMPETTMGRHVIGLNHCAIGIENVGGTKDTPLTKAQLKSNIWLVKYLARKYNIEYVIGHHEYTLFENHELWLEKDDDYRTKKTDPGNEFMAKVRMATSKFEFKPLPVKTN